jgi:prefoldin subunit 5
MKPKEADKAEKIIDQAIEAFDNLIEKVNENNIELYKKHFTSVKKALFSTKDDLLKKLDKL